MRSSWIPLVLLLMYLVLMCLMCRLLDLLFWCQQGISPTVIVDPIVLSVRQLKLLLENRGVSYTGYIEKQELARLVEASADVVQGEVDELTEVSGIGNERERLATTPQPSYFTGSDHFYEQVEDTKDSVWLVQVVPVGSNHNEPLLDDYNWRIVQNQVAPFAIRTGVFDCKLDRRLCNSKGWHEPLLLLAMPRGTKPKDKVIMRTCTFSRPQAIMEWLREHLSIRVQKITNIEELEQNWLHNKNLTTTNRFHDIKVLLLTHLLHPPLFLAALSIKFTGRIKFGMMSLKKEDSEAINKRLNLRSPSYIVITPERTIVYGRRRGEHFHYWSMNSLLRIVQPEMNDVFVCTLALFNMLAALEIVQMNMALWWKRLGLALWIFIRYNCWLFFAWLVIIATQRWSVVSFIIDQSLVVVRYLGLSDAGSSFHTDFQWLLKHPFIFALSFVVFALFTKSYLESYLGGSYLQGEGLRPWWEILPLDCLFRPITAFNQPSVVPDFVHEELRIQQILERLARPDLWLQPTVSTEGFIKDLPMWTFQEKQSYKNRRDSLDTLTSAMDDELPPWTKASVSENDDSDNHIFGCPIKGMILTTECAVCLEVYLEGAVICGLPCGHNYHERCVLRWFQTDNNQCPICRWPVNKTNHPRTGIDFDNRDPSRS